MKKIFVLAALSIFATSPAQAEVVDVSTIKCAELGKMTKDEASYILIWLHGYMAARPGIPPLILQRWNRWGPRLVKNVQPTLIWA